MGDVSDPAWTWAALPARVIHGRGGIARLRAEAERLGAGRVLLVRGGAATEAAALRARTVLGTLLAAEVAGAVQHVTAELEEAALLVAVDAAADAVVAVGGGGTTGLGKLVAMARDVPLLAVPTTYAGSEMTPVWGRTADGVKQTGRDLRALPRTVIYDPDLARGMPARLAAASGINALAHAVEALWAPGRNPATDAIASEAIRRLLDGLPRAVAAPDDADAHAAALTGACLAGASLAQAGGGIHHRTCHVLGGGWNLPHAETHAVVLPHATALVAARARDAVRHVAGLLGTDDAASGLRALAQRLGLPVSLRAIGMPADGVEEAARRVAVASAGDPLVAGADAVLTMLEHAFAGASPAAPA